VRHDEHIVSSLEQPLRQLEEVRLDAAHVREEKVGHETDLVLPALPPAIPAVVDSIEHHFFLGV
jgi:hypothetical protein